MMDTSQTLIIERPVEYQEQLETLVQSDVDGGQRQEMRSRAEIIQHAAAFRHIVEIYVQQNKPLSEQLIKDTHAILVKDINGESAGILSLKAYGGVYRRKDVYAGNQRCPRPNEIPRAMSSLVKNLSKDLEEANRTGLLDPFMLAAKYCDRLVVIHPFLDGNGRICRLILNAILLKYSGILVNVGEHDQRREEYIMAQAESREVGGHAGPLGTIVLREASKTPRRLRERLRIHQ
jgi:Fic family protein